MKPYSCLTAALAFALTLAQAPGADAAEGSAQSATLVRVQMSRDNILFIRLAEPPSVRAGCATDGFWHFTLDLDDAFAKNMYAQILVAYAQGQRVHIGGTGFCNEFATAESIKGFALDTGA